MPRVTPNFIAFLAITIVLPLAAEARAAAPATQPTLRRDSFHRTITRSIGYDYLVQFPVEYDEAAGKKFPLIIFLHGSGECGHDLSKVARVGLPKYAATRPAFEFILVSPQSPSEKAWWEVESLDALLDHVLAAYRVDPERVYLTGLSMGAYGVWDWACHRPQAFAAIAPLAGEGNDDFAADLKNVPVWAFHGAKDKAVSPAEEQRMVNAVNKAGGSAKLTMYPDRGHDVWDVVYPKGELFGWFLAQKRKSE
ncbi:MAG TPA: PHB depolymerase family esterase [Tepidisphaeraceae bacterium]|nr:PHB depolymerase family esterase [Tepidisphaeraceae bacterium]